MKKLKGLPPDALLYLSMAAFLFVASFSFSLVEKEPIVVEAKPELPQMELADLPILTGDQAFPILSSQGALAVDLDSGVTLYEKNADEPLLPASTTKIMTALVALDYYPLDLILEVHNPTVEGQKMRLVKGEKLTTEDLLYGLLVYSANDAAEVIAQNYPGGRQAFIASMNIKARELGLRNTHFENPAGLDGVTQTSTARDLIRLSQVAMLNQKFREIVATKEIAVESVDGRFVHRLKNINELLWEVNGVKGIKTGWTENARENLVTYIERGNHQVMIALLGGQDRFGETKEIINWIFANYQWQDPLSLR